MSVSEDNQARSTLETGEDGSKEVLAEQASEEPAPIDVNGDDGSNVEESPELEMETQGEDQDLNREMSMEDMMGEGENEEQDEDIPMDFQPRPSKESINSKKSHRSEIIHRHPSRKHTGHDKKGSHRTRKRKLGATQHRMPKEEYEQMFYLVPRGVLLQYGPYTFHGVTDFRMERIEGLLKILQKVGATVTLVASTDHVDRVSLWYMDHVIFSCKVTDLNHGGDGETDRLCLDAAKAFDKLSRKAIHGLRNRITLQNQLETRAKNPPPAEPQPAAYERL